MKQLILATALLATTGSCDHTAGNNSPAPPTRQTPAVANEGLRAPETAATQVKPSTAPCPTFTPKPIATPSAVPEPLYGVTIESVEKYLSDAGRDPDKQMKPVLDSLQLARRPTVRFVFNRWDNFEDELKTYQAAAHSARRNAYVLGEILDSQLVKEFSEDCYRYRAASYVEKLGGEVDIWEVGNEVNGGWVREHETSWVEAEAEAVRDKIRAAYRVVHDAGGKTALTLYLNDDGKGNHCWKFRQEEMFAWIDKYVTADMREGLDYVLVSYYEDDPGKDCKNEPSIDGEDRHFPPEQKERWEGQKLNPDWAAVFSKLARTFSKAQVGFGECGTTLGDEKKREQIVKYYRNIDEDLRKNLPDEYKRRYIGGYFWWYFRDDMIPRKKKLWGFFNDVIKQGPNPS
jgi:hypothetical protein